MEKAVEKAAGKIEQHRSTRRRAKTARQQEKLSAQGGPGRRAPRPPVVAPRDARVWTRTEPTGRQPRFTRDQIAAAAIRIADAEGADALSMRRIASELDAGTMTLYHYIRTKDELLALVGDAIMGEMRPRPRRAVADVLARGRHR